MNQKLSILGCGWLGEPLARHFIKKGLSVKGSSTSEDKLQKLKSVGIIPYLINLESLSKNVSEFLDSEILIVALPSKNIEGFKNLISHIEKSPVRKVVFISSSSVYSNSNEILSEESSLNSSNLVEIEQIFRANSLFHSTIIRFAGLLGYDRKPGKFFPKGKKIGNPESFVNMIHQDDCISIIDRIVDKDVWNETFNACTDTHPTRREFYSKAVMDLGEDLPDFIETDLNEYKIISNQKLKMMLDFKFKYPDLLNINDR